jgi:hypothetical protein
MTLLKPVNLSLGSTYAQADAAGRDNGVSPTFDVPVELGCKILPPGVYTWQGTAGLMPGLAGTLTLDAEGDSNAVWIFRIDGISTSAGSKVEIINGGLPANVFWGMRGEVTLGAGSTMIGHMVNSGGVTLAEGATLIGNILIGGTPKLGAGSTVIGWIRSGGGISKSPTSIIVISPPPPLAAVTQDIASSAVLNTNGVCATNTFPLGHSGTHFAEGPGFDFYVSPERLMDLYDGETVTIAFTIGSACGSKWKAFLNEKEVADIALVAKCDCEIVGLNSQTTITVDWSSPRALTWGSNTFRLEMASDSEDCYGGQDCTNGFVSFYPSNDIIASVTIGERDEDWLCSDDVDYCSDWKDGECFKNPECKCLIF